MLYELAIRSYTLAVRLAALSNPKAQKWIEGRENWRDKLKKLVQGNSSLIWFHAASLGEAEQGLPIIRKIRKEYPGKKILLTFFSPSGYENFKEHESVDHIFYLPPDTLKNARDFIALIKPELAVFIKYEIWLNYFRVLQEKQIPIVLAPAIFRPTQFYFKTPFKKIFLPVLRKVDQILVQDQTSLSLLREHAFSNVQMCGDTRMDRTLEIIQSPFQDPLIRDFCGNQKVLILGSSWPPEEKMLRSVISNFPKLKIIIAPHDISKEHVQDIAERTGREICTFYSNKNNEVANFQVLIIDNIGLLSKIYRYAHIAFIGGAFGSGIHNSIEAAGYGMPLIFGPNHQNFIEPAEMTREGFGFEIRSSDELDTTLRELLQNPDMLEELSQKARDYVKKKSGATDMVFEAIKRFLG